MWPALIAAGAQIVGGLIGAHGQQKTNTANAQQVADTNQFNAQQAQAQRDWQERMSNTQYQRAVDDMRAAGLNPALAYQQGGAGTPSGSTASGQVARLENPGAPLGEAASGAIQSAISAYNGVQDAKLKQASAANQQAMAYSNAMEGSLKALENARLSGDDIQEALKKTIFAQLKQIQTNATEGMARAGMENAIATESGTRSRLNTQNFTHEGFNKYVQPWINDAHGVARVWRDLISSLDPIVNNP